MVRLPAAAKNQADRDAAAALISRFRK